MSKKRILFVDDEPLILQALQRMLRSMRDEWEMEFAEGGGQALERMAQIHFDVVVSDMRMPGMNGADLLAEVMKRHPHTVRIILSGHADKELILKCIGSTHQYLAKPCDAEALKATVRRASAVETRLKDETLRKLVESMDRLPSIPTLYTEILDALRDPEVSLEAIGEIVGKDPAMTAKILKLVNSAFFGLRRQIASSTQAANFLGLDTIRSLVLSINAFSQFESVDYEKFSIAALWTHSLDTAALAKQIAQAEQADRKLADESFVAGLLHDTGKMVLAANFPDRFKECLALMQKDDVEPAAAEQQIFGADHADIGGYLLALWGLPVPVVEAIALHHRPANGTEKCFTPLTAVHVGNALSGERAQIAGSNPALDLEYLAAIGLAERLPVWRALSPETATPEQIPA